MPSRPTALAVAFGLIPAAGALAVDPTGWSPFGPAKWTAVVVVSAAAIALVIARPAGLRVLRRPSIAWCAFLAWMAVAAGVGLDRKLAWVGTPQRHYGALTWVLCAAVFWAGHALVSARSARVVAWMAAGTAGLVGAWSLLDLVGWDPAGLPLGDRLGGPLGSAAYLGADLLLLVPAALGLAAERTVGTRGRTVAGSCAALGLVALVGSGARAAWFGLMVGAIVLAWSRRRELRAEWRRAGRRLLLACAVGVAALTGLAWATGTAARVPQAFTGGQAGGSSRFAEWQVAARVLVAHPLTGVGPEGYRIAFGAAVGPGYQRRYGRNPLPDRAHDSLLDVAVTGGLPGLAAYLGLLAALAVPVGRSLRRRREPWLTGLGLGLVAYWAGSLWLFPIAEIEPAAWLLAGIVAVRTAAEPELVTVRPPVTVRMMLDGLIGAAAALAVYLGAQAVAADHDIRGALAARSYQRSVSMVAAAAGRDPGNIVIRLIAAETYASYRSTGGVAAGLGQVAAGLGTSPGDPVLQAEKGTLLVERAQLTGLPRDWSSAFAYLTGLARRDPRNPAVLEPLGLAQASTGHFAAARVSLEAAAGLAPRDPSPRRDLTLVARMQAAGGSGDGTG